MRKLIHNDFELDLSNYKISAIRENHWFADSFFTKYTFPFDVDLTAEIDRILGFISRYNSANLNTYIELKYYHNNTIEDAIFEVEQYQDKLSCTLYFGYDQLPSFEKKLSEISLEKFELPEGVDIYAHAKTIISHTWPAVNYNFPQIHTDKIDPNSDDVWFAFQKIINNYKDGDFLINEVLEEAGDSVTYNRNIMQPLPYWLHVLTRIFADANLILSGEILNDSRLQKKLLYGDVEYFTTVTQESFSMIKMSEDKIEEGTITQQLANGSYYTFDFFRYEAIQAITFPGRYRIIGTVKIYSIRHNNVYIRIKYRNQIIWEANYTHPTTSTAAIIGVTKNVNVVFDTLVDLLSNEITIESWQRKSFEKPIIQLDINPIRLHDAEGNPIPTIINKNEIDLPKAVPDMTCEEFVKLIKNWYNYDLVVENGLAIMNPVEDEINYQGAIDLSMFEVKTPTRKFTKGNSFLLKFTDIDSKDYSYLPVFQNINGTVNSGYVTNEKTSIIEVNALPLPLLVRNGVQTVHAFESNDSKAFAVLYDGLTDGLNLAKDPIDILIPAVHLRNWEKWFLFRINTQGFIWTFKAFINQISELKATSKVKAYGKIHIVKSINDTEVSPGLFEIDIETASLE